MSCFSLRSPTWGAPRASNDPDPLLAMRDKRADANDRMIDVLRKLLADRFPYLIVRGGAHAFCSGVTAKIGHGLDVPDDDVVHGRRLAHVRKA